MVSREQAGAMYEASIELVEPLRGQRLILDLAMPVVRHRIAGPPLGIALLHLFGGLTLCSLRRGSHGGSQRVSPTANARVRGGPRDPSVRRRASCIPADARIRTADKV